MPGIAIWLSTLLNSRFNLNFKYSLSHIVILDYIVLDKFSIRKNLGTSNSILTPNMETVTRKDFFGWPKNCDPILWHPAFTDG